MYSHKSTLSMRTKHKRSQELTLHDQFQAISSVLFDLFQGKYAERAKGVFDKHRVETLFWWFLKLKLRPQCVPILVVLRELLKAQLRCIEIAEKNCELDANSTKSQQVVEAGTSDHHLRVIVLSLCEQKRCVVTVYACRGRDA